MASKVRSRSPTTGWWICRRDQVVIATKFGLIRHRDGIAPGTVDSSPANIRAAVEGSLGIGLVPYSPLGHGLLTGQIRTVDDLPDDDWRKTNPRFAGDNFTRNLAIVDEVRAIGAEIGATPVQTALAWIFAQGDDIAPIPGTRRVARV